MKVQIKKDTSRGWVIYDPKNKYLAVEFPDEALRMKVESYLSAEREYRIPVSQQLDDYRVDKQVPTESLMYMQLALCELYMTLGVWVNWKNYNG